MELMRTIERRDPELLLPASLPEPIKYESQRDFVRSVLASEIDLRANGTEIVPRGKESRASQLYREQLNSAGSPSEIVSNVPVHAGHRARESAWHGTRRSSPCISRPTPGRTARGSICPRSTAG